MKKKVNYYTNNIIGGKYKGKKIEIPKLQTTRSSKNILKESLFNTLQFDIIDKNFVEVFAGSGSIGFEAISRGADSSYFIEHNSKAFKHLEINAKNIDRDKSYLFFGDSFLEFKRVKEIVESKKNKTYFYFDPPFSTREGMEDIYDKTINLIESIEPLKCEKVIIEHLTSIEMPETIGVFKKEKYKKFGRSGLTYYIAI